jgi:hypothetical protein
MPVFDAERLALVGQQASLSRIARLLRLGRPLNIHRPTLRQTLLTLTTRIVSIIVDAVNRMLAGWPRPYVLGKGLQALLIALADLNPTSTVIRIATVVRVQASAFEMSPARIFQRGRHVMCGSQLLKYFRFQASTTLTITITKSSSIDKLKVSTRALTEPEDTPAAILTLKSSFSKRNDGPATKGLTEQINECSHGKQPPHRLKDPHNGNRAAAQCEDQACLGATQAVAA